MYASTAGWLLVSDERVANYRIEIKEGGRSVRHLRLEGLLCTRRNGKEVYGRTYPCCILFDAMAISLCACYRHQSVKYHTPELATGTYVECGVIVFRKVLLLGFTGYN